MCLLCTHTGTVGQGVISCWFVVPYLGAAESWEGRWEKCCALQIAPERMGCFKNVRRESWLCLALVRSTSRGEDCRWEAEDGMEHAALL